MCSDRHYYVFGIGLPEAVCRRYGRTDLQVVRGPDKKTLGKPPKNSYLLRFDPKLSRLALDRVVN